MHRLLIATIALIVAATSVKGQFTIVGPKQEEAGNLVVITLQDFKGNDIIVDCFPKNTYWSANKNLKNEPQVSFATNNQGIYTFVFATNNENKTYVQYWPVQIGKILPIPPEPKPNPTPTPTPIPDSTELSKRLDPCYMVSPNKDQLVKYTQVFISLKSQVDTDKFTTYKQAWDVLVGSTKQSLMSDTDLRALRDEIAKYLVEKTGPQSTKYDKAILSNALNEIVTALNIIQKAHP